MEEREFRANFRRGIATLEREIEYGLPVTMAELYPGLTRETYRFLSDRSAPRQDRIEIVKAVFDIASGDVLTVMEYIFDRDGARKLADLDLARDAETIFSYLSGMADESRRLLETAQGNGIDTRSEEDILKPYNEALVAAKSVVGIILEHINGMMGGDNAESRH